MWRSLAVAGALLASSLTGCSALGGSDGPDSDDVAVVAGFYPLAYVAERVGGDHVEVTDLARPGQEPHDTELTVSQTAQVLDSDLVLHAAGFQPALDDAVADVDDLDVVDALSVLDSRPAAINGSGPVEPIEGDPHFWLDPRGLATVAAEVEDHLASTDPEHAKDYRTNLDDLLADLTSLDDRFATGLEDCQRRTIVVSHDAFEYLGRRYDLDVEPIAGLSPDAEPSPSHLAALADLAQREGVTTVFSERLAGAELADTLADELGLRTAVLDPVEGLSEETAQEDYLSLMQADLEALREANGCQ